MKNVLLIGLGRFGRHLAMQLSELGHQVMAVDRDEERVNECMDFVTNAQIGDSTRVDFLRSLGVGCSRNWGQNMWYPAPNGMCRQNSCCATARTQ